MTRVRRGFVFVVVATLAASGSPGAAAGGQGDHASGGGRTGFQGDTVSVGVESGPSGEDVHGTFSVRTSEGLRFVARATCLLVTGNTATVGGEIVQSTEGGGPFEKGRGVFYAVRDNGEDENDFPDQASNFVPQAVPPTVCPYIEPGSFVLANFVVIDGQP